MELLPLIYFQLIASSQRRTMDMLMSAAAIERITSNSSESTPGMAHLAPRFPAQGTAIPTQSRRNRSGRICRLARGWKADGRLRDVPRGEPRLRASGRRRVNEEVWAEAQEYASAGRGRHVFQLSAQRLRHRRDDPPSEATAFGGVVHKPDAIVFDREH